MLDLHPDLLADSELIAHDDQSIWTSTERAQLEAAANCRAIGQPLFHAAFQVKRFARDVLIPERQCSRNDPSQASTHEHRTFIRSAHEPAYPAPAVPHDAHAVSV